MQRKTIDQDTPRYTICRLGILLFGAFSMLKQRTAHGVMVVKLLSDLCGGSENLIEVV